MLIVIAMLTFTSCKMAEGPSPGITDNTSPKPSVTGNETPEPTVTESVSPEPTATGGEPTPNVTPSPQKELRLWIDLIILLTER